MRSSRIATLVLAASLAYVAPTFTPVPGFMASTPAGANCVTSVTFGSAFAAPCGVTVTASNSPVRPWVVIGFIAGVATVMFNAAYVWQTECRELTSQEAMTASLPVIGMAINVAQGPRSACPGRRHHP